MRKYITKAPAILICLAMIVSVAGATATPVTNTATQTATVKADTTETENSQRTLKDETVYIMTNPNGTVKKIIVSDMLNNFGDKDSINDISDLKDTEVLKGEHTFTKEGENHVWDANGEDIFYQGVISKELPVDVKITYTLDGKEIDPTALTGKSGHLEIKYEFINNCYNTVTINGNDEKIYVPFATLTAIVFDNEVADNLKITNGKIVNDGDRAVAVGITLPGLADNLQLDKNKVDIPDSFILSCDVKNFSMSDTVTLATNEIFSRLDEDKLSTPEELNNSLSELNNAMTQLTDGSSQLYDGLTQLLSKSGELSEGVDKLYTGAGQLKDGAESLEKGASDLEAGTESLKSGADELYIGTGELKTGADTLKEGTGQLKEGADKLKDGTFQLKEGAGQLASGLNTLSQNSSQLNDGAKQIFEALLATANNELKNAGINADTLTIENYSAVLDNVLSSLDENSAYNIAYKTVTEKVNQNEPVITAAVTEKVKQQVLQAVLEKLNITSDIYNSNETIKAQVDSAVNQQLATAEIKQLILKNVSERKALLIEQNMNSPEVLTQIEAGKQQIKSGREKISALKVQLDSVNQFYTGLLTYTAGVDSASNGADSLNERAIKVGTGAASLQTGAGQIHTGAGELSAGADKLNTGAGALSEGAAKLDTGADTLHSGAVTLSNGMDSLYDGISSMHDSIPQLIEGVTQLKDGSLQLYDGIVLLDENGIQKLISAIDGDLDTFTQRLKATIRASKDYNSFAGISDDMDGVVKFIYRTDPIKANDES